MKNLIRIEELAMFIGSFLAFLYFDGPWYAYLLLFLTPDFGMLGYLINTKVGAITYNLIHHKAVAILVMVIGRLLEVDIIMLYGIIMFGHSSFDRIMGYGLKFTDDFKNTHLGKI